MKILAVGAGSMGKRRLRDLCYLAPGQVSLFEPKADRCQQVSRSYGVRGFTNFDEAMADQPDVITISTPPALHEQYVEAALEHNLHVFAEVPFALDLDFMSKLQGRAKSGYSKVIGISCSSRYYPPFRLVRDLLQSNAVGRVMYIEYSLGNYLPDWHPYEDYRNFYAGDMRLGGAGMDMILHELNILHWWFGPVATVHARFSKLSQLEINGPDTQDILLEFGSGARGYFHHDIIERGTVGRHLRIVGEEGTLEWHQNQPTVRLFDAIAGESREIAFNQAADWSEATAASREVNELVAKQEGQSGKIPSSGDTGFAYESCYLREMRHFLDAAEGRTKYSKSSVDEELQTVRTFHAIVRSSELEKTCAVEAT